MMYIVAIGWMFVVTLMAVVEAVSTNGSLLGAVMTFVFYGLLPLALVLYLLGTPLRRRHLKKQDHLADSQTRQEEQ